MGNKSLRIMSSIITVIGIMASLSGFASVKKDEAVPGEFVVKLKNSPTKASQIRFLGNILGGQVISQIADQNIIVIKRTDIGSPLMVAKNFAELDFVDKAEPNFIYRINSIPNGSDFGKLWGLKNLGQMDPGNILGLAGVDINAEKAWDISTGSKDVLVAVIDTGVDYNHPDLKDNIWVNMAEYNGKPGIDDDGNGFIDDIYGYNFVKNNGDPMDDHGHGTHCSGTIGASGNNNRGVVGVNWNVKIMGVKFLSADGGGSLSDAVKAIDYATKMGAKVMNNSWGGGSYSDILKDAIDKTNKAGAVFVAAAGNSSENNDVTPGYPASYQVPNIISVAAINNKGELASFSSYGKKSVHLGAPGVNIYSTAPNGEYRSMSGTSMAAPHVTGGAALLIAANPSMTNLQVKERLMRSARPLASLARTTVSGGMLDVYLALSNQVAPPDANDPENWSNKTDLIYSTPHPYKENSKLEYEVSQPGASKIAVFFSKFETEASWDKVTFFDRNGKKIADMSGSQDESWSPVVEGDYIRIVFTSDASVNKYGFDLTKVAWK